MPSRKISSFHAALDRPRWRKVRRQVLNRDNWTCQNCGRWGNQCDHIKPLFEGGAPYDLTNVQVLCRTHHIEKCRREQTRPEPPEVKEWRELVAERMADSVV